ncbi:MAG: cyclic nucleotide-binding domain-containing protein [Bacteroidota bacterium]
MRNGFIQLLSQFGPLSDGTADNIRQFSERIEIPAQYHLLQTGQICRYIYVIEQGLVRMFYEHDGREVTGFFFTEGLGFTSLESFLQQTPSIQALMSLEACVLWRISIDGFQKLLSERHLRPEQD